MAIGNENSMFKGFQQHDSNELIQFLLDQLHEDLNRVKKKPFIDEPTDKEMREANFSDEDLSTLFDDIHLNRNQSVIRDCFFGQFKSTIVCDRCKIPSKKFQPFMTLPVQISSSAFDLPFYFVPHLPSEKIFMATLQQLNTQDEDIDGVSSQSLYWLKKKICQIVSYFYVMDSHEHAKS